MPLEQMQPFLGHATLETTQVAATSTTALIKRVLHRPSPGERAVRAMRSHSDRDPLQMLEMRGTSEATRPLSAHVTDALAAETAG